MGIAKRIMMEEQEQGWDYSDLMVCEACVDDYALAAAISLESELSQTCSFCRRSPAASLDVLLEVFVNGLRNEYNDPDDELVPYETAEGGYQFFAGQPLETWELVEMHADALVGDGLVEAVANAMHDRLWVDRDYTWRRRDEVLRDAWVEFSDAVKYRTRYVIWITPTQDERSIRGSGEVPPAKVLYDVGRLLDELAVVVRLPAGTSFWRAQTHSGPSISPNPSASRLGTAPRALTTTANRMSPAGIPMFYGSIDAETAIAEVCSHAPEDHDHTTVGLFALSESITVVDLSSVPMAPSMFDQELGHLRRQIKFLHEFIDSMTQPVGPGFEAIDYVPTQVVTEYFLRVFEPLSGGTVRGLVYPSATDAGGKSVVIDIPNDHCLDPGAPAPKDGPFLILDDGTVVASPMQRAVHDQA